MPDAKIEDAAAASPPSSTESWPVTDVGASDDGKLASPAYSPTLDPAGSAPALPAVAESSVATNDSAVGKDPASEVRGGAPAPLADSETTDERAEDTLLIEDWSRTRLPVPDEDGAASGADEPAVAPTKQQAPEGLVAASEAGDAPSKAHHPQTPCPEASTTVPGEASAAHGTSPASVLTDATKKEVKLEFRARTSSFADIL